MYEEKAARDPRVRVDEDCMEARKLLRDVVKVLAQAFDEAWASIAHTVEPARAKKVKSSLARVIVAQAKGRAPKDHRVLKTAALASFHNRLVRRLASPGGLDLSARP